MDTRNLSGRSALVTGAASGIGRETALELARRGADLFLCDVDASGVAATAEEIGALGRQVMSERIDVSSEYEMRGFAERVHAKVEAVDLLVNNAGVGIGGGFLDTTLEDWTWITGVNLFGVVHGCHFFIPAMVRRGRGGHVVIVSSAAGYTPSEALAAYCTTKYGVLGLAESLYHELRPHRIGVTAICPGLIDTPITRNSPLRGAYAEAGVRERMVDVYRRRGYGPDRVARNILRAVARGRVVAPISPEAWVLYYLKRFAPWLLRAIHAKLTARSGVQPRPAG